MKDIAIYGAGGFGREVACLINNISKESGKWKIIGFYDDNLSLKGSQNEYGSVLGGADELNAYDRELDVVIAVGSPAATKSIYQKISNSKVSFPNVISPSVDFADANNFKIGKGNVIQRLCSFSCNVTLGDFNSINSGVGMGHDVVVGSFNSFMPAVRISGEVKIHEGNFFGVSSVVLQQIKIGVGVKIGAGSVLMTKPKDNSIYMGIPAKIFKY